MRQRRLLLILLALLPVAGIVQFAGIKSRYQDWRIARMTLRELESAARSNPADPNLRYHLAAGYVRNNQESLAVPEYTALLRMQPGHPKALNDLGVILMSQGRNAEALLALRAAVQADPNHAKARANLGRLYVSMHAPHSGVEELLRASALDPKDTQILCDLGLAYQDILNYKKALQTYRLAARVDPSNPDVWYGLGETYGAMADSARSHVAIEHAVKLKPNHPRALALLGRMHLQSAKSDNEIKIAERYLRKSLEYDPQNSEALHDIGLARRRLGDLSGAIEAFQRALKVSPSHLGARYQLGRAYVAKGLHKEGQAVLEQFDRMSTMESERDLLEKRVLDERENVDVHLRLAELYIVFQEPAAAVSECRFVLGRVSHSPKAYRILAMASQSLGNMRDFQKYFDRAQELEKEPLGQRESHNSSEARH